jgi:hypothetical protein
MQDFLEQTYGERTYLEPKYLARSVFILQISQVRQCQMAQYTTKLDPAVTVEAEL